MTIRLAVSLPTTAIILALLSAALLLLAPHWNADIGCPALLVPQALVLAVAATRTPAIGPRKTGTHHA